MRARLFVSDGNSLTGPSILRQERKVTRGGKGKGILWRGLGTGSALPEKTEVLGEAISPPVEGSGRLDGDNSCS